MKERHKAVPAVYLILQRGDDILMMRRQGSGFYDGWYSLPAGHVDADELPLGTLTREMKEELGITIEANDVHLVHTSYRTKSDETGDRADYYFTTEKWLGDPVICEPEKCDDIRWFPIDKLPEKTIYYIRQVVEDIRNSVPYSEFGVDRHRP